jgi:hypothetical protein
MTSRICAPSKPFLLQKDERLLHVCGGVVGTPAKTSALKTEENPTA